MGQAFQSTRWSLVLRARDGDDDAAREALEALCHAYWQPLHGYLRRHGHDHDGAADLVQSYFLRFLDHDYLHGVAPDRGRFRAFLLASLKNFVANEWDRTQAAKRGGGVVHLSLTPPAGEPGLALEPADAWTPEREFERRWALTVLARATEALREEQQRSGHAERFARLQPFLTEAEAYGSYGVVAAELALSEGAVKVAVHRLRKRFGMLLRAEVAQTVDDAALVDDELRHLLRAIA